MLILENCIFLASPKTGSKWCHAALKACVASDVRECNESAADYHQTLEQVTLRGEEVRDSLFKPENCIAFVRQPFPWYKSYWNHRIRLGWKASHPLDDKCASDSFETFLQNVLQNQAGFLSRYLSLWAGSEEEPAGFIGRQEHLRDDLAWALKHFRVTFDEQVLRETPKTNCGDFLKIPTTCSKELEDRITASESDLINRFYS